VRSFRTKVEPRRQVFLSLISEIERQLREVYDARFRAGVLTQSSIAEKLGVNRSAINRRLTGRTNMTVETLADMVWALECEIDVKIYPLESAHGRNCISHAHGSASPPATSVATSTTSTISPLRLIYPAA
jgi:hypothetical protein